jgi:hypothetical protein
MPARIYKPAKSAMQSGRANTAAWVLEFEPQSAKRPDPLMGWAGSGDTRGQVRLRFESAEAAAAFASRNHIAYTLLPAYERKLRIKSYAENFAATRP